MTKPNHTPEDRLTLLDTLLEVRQTFYRNADEQGLLLLKPLLEYIGDLCFRIEV